MPAGSILIAMALQGLTVDSRPPGAAPAGEAALAPELQPLAFLVGSCWRATLREVQATDTHCFTPMLGGRFLRDRHALTRVSYSGESIYRWDAVARRIRFDYYQSQGLLISGTAAPAENGLRFELDYVSADGRAVAMRAAWTRDGPDAYVVTTEIRDGDRWRATPGNPRFERAGPAPAN